MLKRVNKHLCKELFDKSFKLVARRIKKRLRKILENGTKDFKVTCLGLEQFDHFVEEEGSKIEKKYSVKK